MAVHYNRLPFTSPPKVRVETEVPSNNPDPESTPTPLLISVGAQPFEAQKVLPPRVVMKRTTYKIVNRYHQLNLYADLHDSANHQFNTETSSPTPLLKTRHWGVPT